MRSRAAEIPRAVTRSRFGARLAGLAAAALVAFLVGLHGLLLWQRLTDLSLLQPAVALRWLLSALLLLALMKLRRLGVPLLWGRRALVFWLVVLLLHAAGPAGLAGPGPDVPLLAQPAGLALALLLVLALMALAGQTFGRAAAPRSGRRATWRPAPTTPAPYPTFFPVLFSRPPPAQA